MLVVVCIGTLRLILIIKGQKLLASFIIFFEVIISVSILAKIIQNLTNIYMLLSYGIGFAVGTYIGMIISEKISTDLSSTNIISKKYSNEIEGQLRQNGFGVTCINGSGKDGDLKILNIICRRTYLNRLNLLTHSIDPKAFIVSHTLQGLSGGFIYGIRGK